MASYHSQGLVLSFAHDGQWQIRNGLAPHVATGSKSALQTPAPGGVLYGVLWLEEAGEHPT